MVLYRDALFLESEYTKDPNLVEYYLQKLTTIVTDVRKG
jgi:hypothetical protein